MTKRMTEERFRQLRGFIESRHGAFIATEDVAGLELLQEVQRARESEAELLSVLGEHLRWYKGAPGVDVTSLIERTHAAIAKAEGGGA